MTTSRTTWRHQTEGKLSPDDYGRAFLIFITTLWADRSMLRANAAAERFKRSRTLMRGCWARV